MPTEKTRTAPTTPQPRTPNPREATQRAAQLEARIKGKLKAQNPQPRTGNQTVTARPTRQPLDIGALIEQHLARLPAERQAQLRPLLTPLIAQFQRHLGGGAEIQPVPGGSPGVGAPGLGGLMGGLFEGHLDRGLPSSIGQGGLGMPPGMFGGAMRTALGGNAAGSSGPGNIFGMTMPSPEQSAAKQALRLPRTPMTRPVEPGV